MGFMYLFMEIYFLLFYWLLWSLSFLKILSNKLKSYAVIHLLSNLQMYSVDLNWKWTVLNGTWIGKSYNGAINMIILALIFKQMKIESHSFELLCRFKSYLFMSVIIFHYFCLSVDIRQFHNWCILTFSKKLISQSFYCDQWDNCN